MSFFQQLFGTAVDLENIIQHAFIVDVREPGEYAQGSVKGAINIPLGNVVSQLSSFKDKENIILFCRSGNRSGQAKRILVENGFKNVVNGGTRENVQQYVK